MTNVNIENGPIVFAHRGISSLAPENTMTAFRMAVASHVPWIETDVDILGDGTPILMHDTELDRTTNKTGRFYDLTRADLADIDAGSWRGEEYAGEPIPLLSDLIHLMNETGLNANIELKSNEAGREMSLREIDAVIAELEHLQGPSKVIISSFNHVLLAEFKRRAPKLPVACLYETAALYDDWLSVCQLVGADYIHPEDRDLTRAKIQAFRDAGLGVNVWTVNDIARANQLFHWGATGVFTDIANQFPSRYRTLGR